MFPETPVRRAVAAAIDFGISNTDIVVRDESSGTLQRTSERYRQDPTIESVRAMLANARVDLDQLGQLAVTGGRHRMLPDMLGTTRIVKVSEVHAIGRGGQAILGLDDAARQESLMVVSAGSGTAMIKARGDQFAHVTGTGIGGGTMLGFARLLLGTIDPLEVTALAERGDRNGVDLSLADVITGPIGSLPADATAVNFGRLARSDFSATASREDIAAALVNLVAQTIGLLATNAARAHDCTRVVIIGHMLDIPYFRHVLELVGGYYSTAFHLPPNAGSATALGALELGNSASSSGAD